VAGSAIEIVVSKVIAAAIIFLKKLNSKFLSMIGFRLQ